MKYFLSHLTQSRREIFPNISSTKSYLLQSRRVFGHSKNMAVTNFSNSWLSDTCLPGSGWHLQSFATFTFILAFLTWYNSKSELVTLHQVFWTVSSREFDPGHGFDHKMKWKKNAEPMMTKAQKILNYIPRRRQPFFDNFLPFDLT